MFIISLGIHQRRLTVNHQYSNLLSQHIFSIWQTSAGAVILTDIVFWCVIVPFLSISRFKLNMVSLLLPY
jgi:hypothetical protein